MNEFWLSQDWIEALDLRKITWQIHATIRMSERDISRMTVMDTLKNCDCIENYPDDKPFQSALFIGWDDMRPIHVVASFNSMEQWIHIITVYEPDLVRFEQGFRKRRTK